jgi:FixJ family two-component response regulator
MGKSIFILDDDADVRETLCAILKSGGYMGVCFVDETSLMEAMRQRSPAAILLDVNLPERSGLEILRNLAAYTTPIVMISGHGDISTAVKAMKDGAVDFIQKPFKSRDLLDRLGKITGPSRDINTALQQKISSLDFPGCEQLTRREQDVLQLAATGSSNKEIGEMLGISYRTVEEHRFNSLHKLGVKNIAELLIAVLK